MTLHTTWSDLIVIIQSISETIIHHGFFMALDIVKSKIYFNTRSVDFFFILPFYTSCHNGD